jgi:hypothetical protein
MYGETYDRHRLPFDSLKYYSWLSLAVRHLGELEQEADGTVLIADTATTRNAAPEEAMPLLDRGRERRDFVGRLLSRLGLAVHVELMSSFIDTPDYQEKLAVVRSVAGTHPAFLELIAHSVPEKYRAEEASKGWTYALEEVAAIFSYDLKVGPPREYFYDEPARLVARSLNGPGLTSVLLHPTWPLGLPMSALLRDPELEAHGVTPYKAGSRGLVKHRIMIEPGMTARAEQLLNDTPVIVRAGIPNPLRQFALTCYLVRCAADPAFASIQALESVAGESKTYLVAFCLETVRYVEDIVSPVLVEDRENASMVS